MQPATRRIILKMLGLLPLIATNPVNAKAKHAKLPVLFLGHGSPMNALNDASPYHNSLQAYGQSLQDTRQFPPIKGILAISAHWETQGSWVTTNTNPPTIHDFSGFPPALNALQYPAHGSSSLAKSVTALLGADVVHGTDAWGLDHGTWSVLHHLVPAANIPVVQLSLNTKLSPREHFELAGHLSGLREQGILIVGSGNIVHNLRALDDVPDYRISTRQWATDFDSTVAFVLESGQYAAAVNYQGFPGSSMAVPTSEHYLPLLYALGAAGKGAQLHTIYEGWQEGTLSMRSISLL